MAKYSLGIDFGSLSARAILVDVADGRQVATKSSAYKHAVIEEMNGKPLGEGWALQDPADYVESMVSCVRAAVAESGAAPEDIIGIGVDFTACTILPVKQDGKPICQLDDFKANPHAYVKMWKNNSAQPYADRVNALATARNEDFLRKYDAISAEWLIPKLMHILEEAPEVFDAADKFIEAGDWIVMLLTGEDRRNSCAAGYKGQYDPKTGYMNKPFLKALDPRLENIQEEKLGQVIPSGTRAGKLNGEYAAILGLKEGTCVAAATIDAHAAAPAAGIAEPGKMLLIMGTSTCHMMLDWEERCFKGLCGVVKDGVLPGFYGYEAGQCAVGDIFQWVIDEAVPKKYFDQAEQAGLGIFPYMSKLAEENTEENVVALDWWNGCRSPLMNGSLKGAISGLTLKSTAVDIFKAAVESTAFGTKRIMDAFESNGMPITDLYACGGIASKNSYIVQVYADVTGRTIRVSASDETVAHGSAIFGAMAAGKENGGYDNVSEAIGNMSCGYSRIYIPNPEKTEIYREKYKKYLQMSDCFSK